MALSFFRASAFGKFLRQRLRSSFTIFIDMVQYGARRLLELRSNAKALTYLLFYSNGFQSRIVWPPLLIK